jgi:hypothetical protein
MLTTHPNAQWVGIITSINNCNFHFLPDASHHPISPLEIKDEVTVMGMAPESGCEREPRQAIGDWHYWVKIRL